MRWTIRKKFLLGYAILFAVAALIVHQVMKISLEENSMAAIENELTKLQHTTREHIKQFTLHSPPKDDLFKEHGSLIAGQLSKLHKQSVALYDPAGRFLYEDIPIDQPLLVESQKFQANIEDNDDPELTHAFSKKAAFTRVDVQNGTLIYFAYPLYIDDQFHGVFRFTGDYTALFSHNQKVLQSLTILTISLFIGVLLISLLLTSQIIQPLLKLTRATKEVATGNFNIQLQVKTKDELEVLATSFNDMQRKVKAHIEMVEHEKEKVMLLEKGRTAFFNNVTHELKTPLATISGYAQIIGEDDFEDTAFLQKAANKIQSESDRMNTMVIELIELSKSESEIQLKKQETVHLSPLLQAICEDMRLKARKHQMQLDLDAEDFIVYGHQDELRQVIINILDNAIKYGVNGEKISISSTGGIITVTNKSTPIPEAIIAHAFEPFIYTKGKGSSGLGLYICKQIISQHNGTISFHYENGQAIISIQLPLWQQNGNNLCLDGNT